MKNTSLTLITTAVLAVSLTACSNARPLPIAPATSALEIVPHHAHEEGQAHDEVAHPATWSYAGETAPKFWGDIAGNETCKIGKEQSPVNITKVISSSKLAPKFGYGSSDIEVLDSGHAIVFTPQDDDNTIVINGDTYALKQFHYHTPSEHQISGSNYPAEFHFVHVNAQGNLAVIGVMLNPTATAPVMTDLIRSSKFASSKHTASVVEAVDLQKLLPKNASYYHYGGSLTTPPCSEQVQWYVMDKPLAVYGQELAQLVSLYQGNNRPVQPLGDRDVLYIK